MANTINIERARTKIRIVTIIVAITLLFSLNQLQPSADAADCTVISSLPYAISAPGKYCLDGDLTSPNTSSVITINADNVILDLNGFTISSGFFPPGPGIGTTPGHRSITIRNGTLKGFEEAIRLTFTRFAVIEDIRVQSCFYIGINVSSSNGTMVRNNQIVDTVGTPSLGTGNVIALLVSGTANNILNNDIVDTTTTSSGVVADAIELNPSDRSVVENNRIEHTTGTAIYISSSSGNAMIVNNRIVRSNTGIHFAGPSGIYRDNIALGCDTPYSGGTNAGNNQ
jgi:hypothetical protein